MRRRALLTAGGLLVAGLALPAQSALASGNHFYAGYCTWYAAQQGYSAWGVWVPWLGDAGDWGASAAAYGWAVSSTPVANSVFFMPRYVQGSGSYGHVGWVAGVDADGSGVTVSSMNWSGWNVISTQHFAVDGAVQFLTPA